MRNAIRVLLTLLVAAGGARLAVAQAPVTAADIPLLQDAMFEAGNDLARLRTGDAALRGELQAELDVIRDAIAGFKSKLGSREAITRQAFASARERMADVRRRARGERTVRAAGSGPTAIAPDTPPSGDSIEVPAGTTVDVTLLTALSPESVAHDDRLEAATRAAVTVGGRVVIPAGTLVRGVVMLVQPPARRGGTPKIGTASPREAPPGAAPLGAAMMTIRFREVTVNYRAYPISGTATKPIAPASAGAVVRLRFEGPVRIDAAR